MKDLAYKLENVACKLMLAGAHQLAAEAMAGAENIRQQARQQAEIIGELMGIEANIINGLTNRAVTAETKVTDLTTANTTLTQANADLQTQLTTAQANGKDALDLAAEAAFNPDGTPKTPA